MERSDRREGTDLSYARNLPRRGHTVTLDQVKVVGERNQEDRDFQLETLSSLPA